MNKKLLIIFSLLLAIAITSCNKEVVTTIIIKNPLDFDIKDAVIVTEINTNLKTFDLLNEGNEIPFQIVTEENKSVLKFVIDLNKNETKTLQLVTSNANKLKEFKSRTHAELSAKTNNVYFDKRFRGNKFDKVNNYKVPAIHTDHDALFKYEGPGWESELVGYRFYLDWRNATDIFGKKKNQLILDQVGNHDTVAKDDSYHSMQEWGMDIFKVGSSLGIGSIGMWADDKVNMVSVTDSIICTIPYTGPIEAKIITNYFGWKVGENKYNLVSDFSITAGSRLTKCDLKISDNADNIVTGLVKHENTELLKSGFSNGWNYLALYGKQTLVDENDELGIVIFYKQDQLIELTEDEMSYVIKLKPEQQNVTYYFAAAWNQEENRIKNIEQFKKYLEKTLQQLNTPVIVDVK
jgi:hypothetical protein